MRKAALVSFALYLCAITSFSQTGSVKGRVIDSKTFKPLQFATVYLNLTTIGSVTDDQGDFQLQNIPVGQYEIVVSYVGYQPYQSRVIVNDTIPLNLSIKMVVSTTNLAEVVVKSKKDTEWNNLLEKFRRQFLGVSPYTSDCKILNPWVLDFTEGKDGILTAKASAPLEIENLGLGYNLTCTLKEFLAGPNLYKISGTYRFAEAQTHDTTLSALWHSRREEVYRGSPRHLFKSIIENRVVEEGFDLYSDITNNPEVVRNSGFLANINVSLKPILPNELLGGAGANGQYTIKLPARMEVHYLGRISHPKVYRNITHPVSWIEVSGGSLTVTTSGIVTNPGRMLTLGAMGEARIAEVLPLNYQPATVATNGKKAANKSYSSLAALLEKPYLMTDKPYYYPADAILFKAFFNYISPVYRDSLSHVIHVELIDASKNIIQSKLFPVSYGTSNGNINLSSGVKPGDYTLRAYTRWMMNFDPRMIFTKAIKILAYDELAEVNDVPHESKQLTILTEKNEFETREKITFALEASSFYGNVVPAELAISVTDIEQATIPRNEKNILTQFPFSKDMLPDSSLKKPEYFIQHGMDFKGQMIYGKKSKQANGVIMVYQENLTDVFAVTTDALGKFHQQLQVMDSVDLYLSSTTAKGKNARVIIEPIKDPVPLIDLATPLNLEVFKPSDPSRYHKVDLYSTAKMLEAVTVQSTRVERPHADQKHVMSDVQLTGDYLRSTNQYDLLTAMRGRVPGLQVLYIMNPTTGDVKKFLTFPGNTTQWGMAEPMVELDGIVLTAFGGESIADRLANMSVQEIESVTVLRHASATAYGVRAFNGVIIIKTRVGSRTAVEQPKIDRTKLQHVSMRGYSTVAEFSSPEYSDHTNGDDRTDYRSTIYWNPVAFTDGKEPLMLSFYAADIPTHYRIVVEGVTADGEAVRAEKIIVVTGKK